MLQSTKNKAIICENTRDTLLRRFLSLNKKLSEATRLQFFEIATK